MKTIYFKAVTNGGLEDDCLQRFLEPLFNALGSPEASSIYYNTPDAICMAVIDEAIIEEEFALETGAILLTEQEYINLGGTINAPN